MGPLVRSDAVSRVCCLFEKGVQEGARLVLDGRSAGAQDGFFLRPSIFDDVSLT